MGRLISHPEGPFSAELISLLPPQKISHFFVCCLCRPECCSHSGSYFNHFFSWAWRPRPSLATWFKPLRPFFFLFLFSDECGRLISTHTWLFWVILCCYEEPWARLNPSEMFWVSDCSSFHLFKPVTGLWSYYHYFTMTEWKIPVEDIILWHK